MRQAQRPKRESSRGKRAAAKDKLKAYGREGGESQGKKWEVGKRKRETDRTREGG